MYLVQVVWEEAGAVAPMSVWAATFGYGLGGVMRIAEELENLAKPLGVFAVVGCAFSRSALVALLTRTASLMALEHEGRDELAEAWDGWRQGLVFLVAWLFGILGSYFMDQDRLVGKVFDVLEECLDVADDLEQSLLRYWAIRAAEDVDSILGRVDSVQGKLLGAGFLNAVATHERRIDDL